MDDGYRNPASDVRFQVRLLHAATDRDQKVADTGANPFCRDIQSAFAFTHCFKRGDVDRVHDQRDTGDRSRDPADNSCLAFMSVHDVGLQLAVQAVKVSNCMDVSERPNRVNQGIKPH
jgi:hypothetical protein